MARWFLRTYLGRIGVALFLIVIVQATYIWLFVVLPYQREKQIAEKIKANKSGEVALTDYTPDWIPQFVSMRLPVQCRYRISSITFHDEITDAELEPLKSLTSLKYLHLENTDVNDAGLERLKRLPSLVELGLVGTQITDAGLKHLQGFKSLGYLYLNNTQITDVGIEYLKELDGLVVLNLMQTRVTGVGLDSLSGLGRFEYLSLDGTLITDAELNQLKRLRNLKSVSLNDTQTTPDGRAMLRRALPNCVITPDP